MKEVGGYAVSGSECNEKWRNLQATYKRNKDKKGTSGHQAVTWEYFEVMDKVLGTKASTKPPSSQLFSSLQGQGTDPPTDVEPQPSTSKKAVHTKRRASDIWIEAYRQTQEKRSKQWEEQKELEEKKIEAINNLAAAIAGLANKPEQ